jgi:hypothetical protein
MGLMTNRDFRITSLWTDGVDRKRLIFNLFKKLNP